MRLRCCVFSNCTKNFYSLKHTNVLRIRAESIYQDTMDGSGNRGSWALSLVSFSRRLHNSVILISKQHQHALDIPIIGIISLHLAIDVIKFSTMAFYLQLKRIINVFTIKTASSLKRCMPSAKLHFLMSNIIIFVLIDSK